MKNSILRACRFLLRGKFKDGLYDLYNTSSIRKRFAQVLIFCSIYLAQPGVELAFPAGEDPRSEFLQAYYKADYAAAHSLLNEVFQDPVTREIWESRIHLQEPIATCSSYDPGKESAHAMAYVRIGNFEKAKQHFTDDWLSCWGAATLSFWRHDLQTARQKIQEALILLPERPELLFFAGDVAGNQQQTIDCFTKFLAVPSEDAVKRSVAEFSIEFLKKTAGIDVNHVTVQPGIQELDTDYNYSTGITIRAQVDTEKKLRLMVDTGAASGMVLEKRNWKPQAEAETVMLGLGKKQISNTKRLVLGELIAGPFTIRNPVAASSGSMPHPDIQGLIGSALFSTHKIVLPVRSGKKMVLIPYDQDPFEYFQQNKMKFSKQETVPFSMINKLILIKGRIEKSDPDMDILLDTGSDVSLISVALARKEELINYPFSLQMRKQMSIKGVGGTADNLLIAENVEVSIAGISKSFNRMLAVNFAETSEALDLELDLLLGRDFLQGYTLLIDYKNLQLSFLK